MGKKYSLIGEIADFDYHGNWGDYCSPRSLHAFLDGCQNGERVEIEINSPGGLVIQGVEMANAIKNSKAHVVAHVTGIAASMASVIACACDEIEMEEASFMMIHNPWGKAIGDADEMRKEASVLDQMKAICMAFYRGKFARTDEELAALMSDETWYTGAECQANGLKCTVIKSDFQAAASVCGKSFEKMPEGAAKFLTKKELTEEGRAEIEAAKAAAKAENAAAKSSMDNKTEAAATPAASSLSDGDWESRYKGASKKINALQARIAELEKREADRATETVDYGAVVKERDGLKAQVAALEQTGANAAKALKDFEDQVKQSGFESLAALIGAVSGFKSDLEKRDGELAECRQQLDHMKATRDLLTAGVLSPSNGADSYEAKMAAAKTPQERENLRAMKKAGKIK